MLNVPVFIKLNQDRGMNIMTNEALVKLIQDGENTADNLQTLYDQNKGMIHRIARKFTGYAEYEDLMQEGFIGLYEAVKRYEDDREVKFISFAIFWIRQSMYRYIENTGKTIRIPPRLNSMVARYKKVVNAYQSQIGRDPSDFEAMRHMYITDAELKEVKQYISCMNQLDSLDSNLAEDGESTVGEMVPSGENVEDNVIDKMMLQEQAELWNIVKDNVTDQQNKIIEMKYRRNMTVKAIGENLGINDSAVRTDNDKALKKLRTPRIKNMLVDKYDIVMPLAYRGGVGLFKTTWTSSTERAAFKLNELRGEV